MAINPVSNLELWNGIRARFPQFASHTAEGTAALFSEQGWEALKATDPAALDEFYGLSLRVHLQLVNASDARDPWQEAGFGETYDVPFGAIIQRLAVNAVKPVTPAYRGLVDGDSPDPFVVRKAESSERFFKQNFDYQSLLTVPDDYVLKQIFITENGMSTYQAGIMQALATGYKIQKYENKKEALNKFINSVLWPLQDSQTYEVELQNSDLTADGDAKLFILGVKNVLSAMTAGTQSSAFNAYKFKTTQDKSRLKLLLRTGIKNAIEVNTLTGAFNPEYLNLGVDVVEVTDFGGLVPTTDGTLATRLYPVYDELGTVIGYAGTEGAETPTVTDDAVKWYDPNADVLAVLADKGLIFEGIQNPYTVEPIRNPRGLYTNYWANSPGNTVAVDPLYNAVIFKRKAQI